MLSQTCTTFFDQTFCFRNPTEQEAGVILILTLCLIAGRALRNRSL